MCTNQKHIINPYTGQSLFVKCGKCKSCLQEKAAHRVSRIKATDNPDLVTYMLTLTYRPGTCPYVLRSQAHLFAKGALVDDRGYSIPLPVYRDRTYRKVRCSSSYDLKYKCTIGKRIITLIDYLNPSDFHGVKDMKHEFDKIGIAFYPDVQAFIARLRLNLKRKYNYDYDFKFFICSEYGTKTLRPHFHILFWIRKGDSETLRNAAFESWPFSNLSHFPRAFERTYAASSYVASYVNSGDKFPLFLKDYFKAKHSYSKGFGLGNMLFNINTILAKFNNGNLSLFKLVDKQGKLCTVECPYPKYVIHRYFPKFKGYSRFVGFPQSQHMQRFAVLTYEQFLLTSSLAYTKEEYYKIRVRLCNAYQRFIADTEEKFHISFAEYCILHTRIWTKYNSVVLRLHLENRAIPINEKYDNLSTLFDKCYDPLSGRFVFKRVKPLPVGFSDDMLVELDPNKFRTNVANTLRFEKSFNENIKHRNVNNSFMSEQSDEF